MSLFLLESSLVGVVASKEELDEKVADLQGELEKQNATLIELQVAKNFDRAFFIVEAEKEETVVTVLTDANVSVDLVKNVRLVGDDLESVKQKKDVVNYIVEWNLPEDLTMDKYLARKEKNSVHYEEVPEVSFARTYVCEDMSKCLCFYDAPDEGAVNRAREAVQAPIDSITELEK